MIGLTTQGLIDAAKSGARDAPIAFDLIHEDGFDGARWDARDANDPATFVRRLYQDGFQNDGDPMPTYPFGSDDVVTVVVVDEDPIIFGENGDSFAAYQIVPADENAAPVCVWWEDGADDRERGFYFDSAEDSGGFDRISPNGPHSTRHAAELAALDLYRSARFIPSRPMHYG